MIPRASVLITTELDSDGGTLGGLCAARGAVRSSLDPVKVMPGAPPRARMVTNCIRTVHVDTQDSGKCMGSGKWVGHDLKWVEEAPPGLVFFFRNVFC